MTPLLLARYHREAQVVGADLDEALVARNETLVRQAGIRNLRFTRLDLREPSGLDPQDVVILADVVANRPGDDDLIRGASRIVRPGGRLLIHTATRHPPRTAPSLTDTPDLLGAGYAEGELRRALEAVGAREVRFRRTYGRSARLAGRVLSAIRPKGRAFGTLFFPVSLLIALPDLFLSNRDGDGILAIALMGEDA